MDKLTPENRSENMRRIRGKDTAPELAVRKLCREIGFSGYRIHRKDLPGKPDLAWVGRRRAIFVNGCFWHGHECTEGLRKPRSNQSYWIPKIQRNKQRDSVNIATLRASGWSVLTVWECEITKREKLAKKLKRFLSPKTPNNAFNADAPKRRAG
ncbi:MAG TPA: very short patch repair endonuclease [Gammaproteobacteria bacterium]|nr:very short patch repair endonuclease [Gammaproteobacteria bacterium]